MNLRDFFAELKRRNVYKAAVAYAVVGWLLIQVATQVFPFFDISNWAVRVVILVIVAGLPIALIIAWAFELTPQGLKRTEDARPDESRAFRHVWIYVAAIGATVSVAIFLLTRYLLQTNEPPAKSIAVLPFDNLSSSADNAYFTQGIEEEIVTRLAKVAALKVISRGSTQQFQSSPDNVSEVAQRLGVKDLLEGTVQRVKDQVRVNVQLINASTDTHLWGDSYDRKVTDIFGVESDIAESVVDTLEAKLTGAERHAIAAHPTDSTAAHEAYLRGRFFWNKRDPEDFQIALSYFQRAIREDPNYAVAYSGMADCYLLLPLYGSGAPAQLYPQAETMAQKAVDLDPTLAEPHASLGLLHALFDFNFLASVREFETAIRLNPNYATGHQWFGDSTLPALGEFDRANAQLQQALSLDPLSLTINDDVGTTYTITGHYAEAIAQLRKTIEMDPDSYYPHRDLGQALEYNGDLAAALPEYEQGVKLGDDPYSLALLGAARAKAGQRPPALAILAQLQALAQKRYVSDYSFALLYLALSQKDEAMHWLESSYEKHQPDLNWIRIDPALKSLQGDPRFEALAEKIVPLKEFHPPANYQASVAHR